MEGTIQMNIKEQIETVNLNSTAFVQSPDNLCRYMLKCPPRMHAAFGGCSMCVGEVPMKTLKQIQPKLTQDNLEDTLIKWKVLVG